MWGAERWDAVRVLSALLLALALLRFGGAVVDSTAPGMAEDVAQHWVAARLSAEGGDPYASGALRTAGERYGVVAREGGGFHFLARHHYPPLGLVLWRPLAALPYDGARWAWLALTVVLSLACLLLLESLLRVPPGSNLSWLIRAGFLGFGPVLGTLNLGQMGVLIFAGLLAGLKLDRDGRSGWAGGPLAVAILLKVLPGVWLLVFAAGRRWRAVGSTLCWMVGLTALSVLAVGWSPYARYIEDQLQFGTGQEGWQRYVPNNVSATAFLLKGAALLTGGHDWERLVLLACAVSGAALLIAVLYRATRIGSDQEDAWLGAVGLACATVSLVSPMTWQHHLVWLALPLAAGVKVAWQHHGVSRAFGWWAAAWLLLGLDPWAAPLRALTSDLPPPWKDVVWSVPAAGVLAGMVLTWLLAYRLLLGRSTS
jgi:hypothetical protein